MKLFTWVLFGVAMISAGCESMSSRINDRFSGVPPQTRMFAADEKAVYDAGIKAVKSLQMNLGRTSRSKGSIEAYNAIRSGDAIRDARQTSLQINIFGVDGGESRVELLVLESTEGSFPGGVSQQQLRMHSLYESYYNALERQLIEAGALKAPSKP